MKHTHTHTLGTWKCVIHLTVGALKIDFWNISSRGYEVLVF